MGYYGNSDNKRESIKLTGAWSKESAKTGLKYYSSKAKVSDLIAKLKELDCDDVYINVYRNTDKQHDNSPDISIVASANRAQKKPVQTVIADAGVSADDIPF